MGRFGLILILAGLAVGLWLGFNPSTHGQLARLWENARSGHADTIAQPLINFRRLDRKVNRWLGARDEVAPAPQPQAPRLITLPQVTHVFQAFWQALKQLEIQFIARLRVQFR